MCDASCLSQPGSKGTDWRIHATYDLGGARFSQLELTDGQGAEALIADPDGGLWIGSVKGVCHWAPGASAVYSLKSLEQAEGGNGVQALALEKNGSLLVAVGHTGPGAGLQMLFSGLWTEYKAGNFRGANAHHIFMVQRFVVDVAGDVLFFESANAVFEAGCSWNGPRPS